MARGNHPVKNSVLGRAIPCERLHSQRGGSDSAARLRSARADLFEGFSEQALVRAGQ